MGSVKVWVRGTLNIFFRIVRCIRARETYGVSKRVEERGKWCVCVAELLFKTSYITTLCDNIQSCCTVRGHLICTTALTRGIPLKAGHSTSSIQKATPQLTFWPTPCRIAAIMEHVFGYQAKRQRIPYTPFWKPYLQLKKCPNTYSP